MESNQISKASTCPCKFGKNLSKKNVTKNPARDKVKIKKSRHPDELLGRDMVVVADYKTDNSYLVRKGMEDAD